jgi:hypothetical protein
MASARSFMNATPNEELPFEETHHSTSYSFLNIAPLPKKKKQSALKLKKKKKKRTQRFSHPHKENCSGRNEDEVTDKLPPSKEAVNRVKLKKQKEKDLLRKVANFVVNSA